MTGTKIKQTKARRLMVTSASGGETKLTIYDLPKTPTQRDEVVIVVCITVYWLSRNIFAAAPRNPALTIAVITVIINGAGSLSQSCAVI